ncbi:MAG TPA: DapH/DapD/GlmU-related protein, partial [Thermoanaerobaculia bacterium]|nr:DapH/DapD/GlmU-related protein [Thermoanaerobaculia bacterium]
MAVRADAEVIPLPDVEPLAQECRHFLECVATRQQPRTDGASGVAVLRVLEACQRSLERGGAPVSLAGPAATPCPLYFAHATATIDAGCEIGEGTRIWHYAHVMPGARVGRGCSLGQNVFVGSDVVIGDNVKIQNNVSVYDGVVLQDDVFCGPSMVFTNVVNPRSHVARKHEYRTTLVRQGATIGANATIVCGHTIGRYAFIGAGAVITRDIPD